MQENDYDITCIITLTSMSSEFYKIFTNDIFVDVSIYKTIDHELCHHCFALPCECVQMDILMTAKKRLAETLKISDETTKHVYKQCVDKI